MVSYQCHDVVISTVINIAEQNLVIHGVHLGVEPSFSLGFYKHNLIIMLLFIYKCRNFLVGFPYFCCLVLSALCFLS